MSLFMNSNEDLQDQVSHRVGKAQSHGAHFSYISSSFCIISRHSFHLPFRSRIIVATKASIGVGGKRDPGRNLRDGRETVHWCVIISHITSQCC